ncbi:MAG: acyl-CoA dehydrogenase family protein [Alphaproteobacteria bacterium]
MDFGFTEEQLILRDSVREFVRNEVPESYIRACDQTGQAPLAAFEKLARMGWMGAAIPEEYGGAGLGWTELGIILEGLSYASLDFATLYYRATVHGAQSLLTYGSDEQKKKYLPLIAAGKFKSSLSLSEPNAGSDAAGIQTRAVQDGDWFIVNGQKIWNSQIDIADRTVLAVRTDPTAPRHAGLSLLFVDPKSPGVSYQRLDTLCFRSVGTFRVTYDDVRVHKSDLLGQLNKGWTHLMTNLEKERFSLCAMSTGCAQNALDCAVQYAKDRIQFGKPIGSFQAIQHKIAEMQMQVHLVRVATYDLARRLEAGIPCRTEASMAKIFASEIYHKVADDGMQILGGYSMTPDFPMERHYRDCRIHPIGGGSTEVLKTSIAKDLGLGRA